MYEYSVNDDHTEAHIIERCRADAVVSHIEEIFAPFGKNFSNWYLRHGLHEFV